MDNSFYRKDTDAQQKGGNLDRLLIFDRMLSLMRQSVNWLVSFIKMTAEEQENAGVYLGRPGDE